MSDRELISISDFLVVLIRRKWTLVVSCLLVMACVVLYLWLVERTYRLKGIVYVGRFQEILLEEGEFVANKLEDYSFIKRALDSRGIKPSISIMRLQKLIKADVVNEVKKIKDVGIVELTVEYKGREMTYQIYKALTDQLIQEHGGLLDRSAQIFTGMIAQFEENEKGLMASIAEDDQFLRQTNRLSGPAQTVPAYLLASHTLSEKRENLKTMIKDRHYLMIEADSATKSYNTKLAAEPDYPDAPVKPVITLTLAIGLVAAFVIAVTMALLFNLYDEQIKPRLNNPRSAS